MANRKPAGTDPEIAAIGFVYDALRSLNAEAQRRVLEYVAGKIGVSSIRTEDDLFRMPDNQDSQASMQVSSESRETEDSEGISPIAQKWMKRSDLTATGLSEIYSLGVDEIDLVAKKVPGETKKDRMHSVLLLKGIAAYLSTGVARITHDQVKEACLHYDAFDSGNFSKHLRSFTSEVAGTKESGYTLTARGLTNATGIIKSLTGLN